MSNLLGSREIHAKPALERVAQAQGLQLSFATKLSSCFEIKKSGLSNENFEYASRACFDFVFMDEKSKPLLAVEVDASDKDEIGWQRARRKDSVAHRVKFPLIRFDVTTMPADVIDQHVGEVMTRWFAYPHTAEDVRPKLTAPVWLPSGAHVVHEFQVNEYSTKHRVRTTAAGGNFDWDFMSHATVTVRGGIDHGELATLASAAKMRSFFEALR